MSNDPSEIWSRIIRELVQRYRAKAEASPLNTKITAMLDTLEQNVESWPVDKTSRWIGFIQGILFVTDTLDIQEERDFTRPLFHEYYKATGISIPESVAI